jgi:hypothetical protein
MTGIRHEKASAQRIGPSTRFRFRRTPGDAVGPIFKLMDVLRSRPAHNIAGSSFSFSLIPPR